MALGVSLLAHLVLLRAMGGVRLPSGVAEKPENRVSLQARAEEARPEPVPPPRTPRPPPSRVARVQPLPRQRPLPRVATSSLDPQPISTVPGVRGVSLGFGGQAGAFGDFDQVVGEMRQRGLDVVFALDTTASMRWVLEIVRERIQGVIEVVRTLIPTSRFGFVAYRDRDDEYATRVLPLTFQPQRLHAFLAGVRAEGGGDLYEGVDAGILAAIDETGFRAGAVRVIVLVADAPPHPEEMERLVRRIEGFRDSGGVITVLDASLESNPQVLRERFGFEADWDKGVLPEFVEIADAGGGEVATLGETSQVVRQLVVAIFGSRWIDWLLPFLGGLE